MSFNLHIQSGQFSTFLAYTQNCATITTANFRTFHCLPIEAPYPVLPNIPSPPALYNHLLSTIYIVLPTLDISNQWGSTTGVFCDWLSIIFSGSSML